MPAGIIEAVVRLPAATLLGTGTNKGPNSARPEETWQIKHKTGKRGPRSDFIIQTGTLSIDIRILFAFVEFCGCTSPPQR
jgi:hypothetical protein